MGNVHVGSPRAFLVRRRLRRLFKKMTHLLIDADDADGLDPQQIAEIRDDLVDSLCLVRLELATPGATRHGMQAVYDEATTTYNTARELLHRFHVEVFDERHEHIDAL